MNRNISDLMDHIRDADVELETNTPLSASGIKELTMRKIEQKKNPKRIAFRVLMAAAIIVTLAVSVFAAEKIFGAGDWFRDAYEGSISEDQVEVINQLGKSFEPQSITSEGTTVTLASAYGDENVLYLYLKVAAPEGIVLPDDIIYDFCDHNNDVNNEFGYWESITVPEGSPYKNVGYDMRIEPLADENPSDNEKEFVVRFHSYQAETAKFNDGVTKFFHMTGIYEQVPDVDGDTDGYVLLAPGDFTFEVGIVNEASWLELDVSDTIYSGTKSRTWTCGFETCGEFCEGLETNGREHTEYWDVTVVPISLKISNISAEWACNYRISDMSKTYGLDFQIFMKDGTNPAMSFGGGANREGHSEGTVLFDKPIIMEEIDYILIGDEELGETYKIYLPETSE